MGGEGGYIVGKDGRELKTISPICTYVYVVLTIAVYMNLGYSWKSFDLRYLVKA